MIVSVCVLLCVSLYMSHCVCLTVYVSLCMPRCVSLTVCLKVNQMRAAQQALERSLLEHIREAFIAQ